MDTLGYKTRAGSAPNGKPRVYLCCHPEDCSIYLEPMAQELLELWDCAVWYRQGERTEEWSQGAEEEALDILGQMQLVVVPVSEAFLYEEGNAARREFDLAVAHHIPVLPILVEGGLAGAFNQRCGTMQCLDRTSQDVTEIPYREKLKKFLDAVLVPDDLAQQVRAAFDAYVFLSYRKKDRRYAQELMRLIHANPFCRDIAIWYDEFLSPGEDFNDTIAQALQKSRLFALAVTPNLVNEKNYVMDVEYPMARQAGKKILPAQLCPTDRRKLEQCYQGLPQCVDSRDQAALSDSLLEALQGVAVGENDSSPEHLLFIGLAYLGGIDVEVDLRRGVELVTQSAQLGLPQAMDKLVTLYGTGTGVPLDQGQAIEWQEKLVAALSQEPGQEAALLEHHQRLAHLCWACQRYPRAQEACRGAMGCLARGAFSPQVIRDTTLWYYDHMGRIAQALGRLEEAQEHFLAHQMLSAQWAREEGGIPALDSWMVSYDRLGQLSLDQGELEQALEQFTRGRALARQVDQQVHTVSAMNRRLTMELQCSRVLLDQGRLNDAMEAYESLLPLARQLAREGDSQAVTRYIGACYDMSQLCGQLGQLDKGVAYARQGLAGARALAQEMPTLSHQRNLAALYLQYGDSCLLTHTPDKTLDPDIVHSYRQGAQLAQQVAQRTGSAQGWMDVSRALERVSRWYGLDGQEEREERTLTQAIEAAQRGVDAQGGVEARRQLADLLQQMSRLCRERMDAQGEQGYTRRCFQLRQEIARDTDAGEDLVALASAHQAMGLWAEMEDDHPGKLAHLEESVRLCREVVRREPTVTRYRKTLSAYYQNLALTYFRGDDVARYRAYAHKALELEEELVKEDGSPMAWWSLAGQYEELMSYGSQDEAQGWEETRRCCQRYLQIYQELARRDPSKEQLDRLATAWDRASGVAQQCEQWQQALAWQREESQVRQRLLAQAPHDLWAYDRAMESQRRLAQVCLEMEDLGQVETYGEEYLRRVVKLPRTFGGQTPYRGQTLTEYAGERTRLLMQECDEKARGWKEAGEYQLAEDAWAVAVDCAKTFLELQPGDREGRGRLAMLHFRLADARPDSYVVYDLEQALKLWEGLAQEFPHQEGYAQNARAVRRILED